MFGLEEDGKLKIPIHCNALRNGRRLSSSGFYKLFTARREPLIAPAIGDADCATNHLFLNAFTVNGMEGRDME